MHNKNVKTYANHVDLLNGPFPFYFEIHLLARFPVAAGNDTIEVMVVLAA